MTKLPSRIIAIDPGTTCSGWVDFDFATKALMGHGNEDPNELVLERLKDPLCRPDLLVVEMIQPMGMPLGFETILTAVWTGRFVEGWGKRWDYLHRGAIKTALCGTVKAKDPNVRQAVLDRFGGNERAIGNKKTPGPLYGVSKHAVQAMALCLAYADGVRVRP